MTFIEAYELYGRDSMAIAEATGLSEAEAYNLMAARADRDRGIFPTKSPEWRREYHRGWRERLREYLREARA